MKFATKLGAIRDQSSACVVVGAYESGRLTAVAQEIDRITDGTISKLVSRGDVSGKLSQTVLLPNVQRLGFERILVAGLGKAEEMKLATYRKAIDAAAAHIVRAGCGDALFCLHEIDVPGVDLRLKAKHTVEATGDAGYRFDELKTAPDSKVKLQDVYLFAHRRAQVSSLDAGIRQGFAVGTGKSLAKDLGNLPGNVCTPTYLANKARSLQKSHALKTTVIDEQEMRKLGMGALLSVSKGSRQPAKLVVMRYEGATGGVPPVALVGKGLTFDAGGISLKQAAQMDEMKFDMCGGASVFGALVAAAEMQLPLNIVGIVPSSENLPDGDANKPGDIITSMSGKTVEILNTDAEGRLILCDALTYAERFKPDAVIDIATLTGACVVALGKQASGLMGNDQALMEQLLEAGETSLDRAWPLPLWDEYQSGLDSNFADMANIGGRYGGAITAACFLSRFTKSLKWAHLDIAGTAWLEGKEKGATGRAVPLLSQYLIDRCH